MDMVDRLDGVISIGALVILICSLFKTVSLLTAHDYASKRTERTPEKKVANTKFVRAVTVTSFFLTLTIVHLLNEHATATVDAISKNENSLLASPEMLTRITDSVASLQTTLFVNFVLHGLVHFFSHRLNKIEASLPRIIDLQAASSTPKKEQ